jgi:hypothetical protein
LIGKGDEPVHLFAKYGNRAVGSQLGRQSWI